MDRVSPPHRVLGAYALPVTAITSLSSSTRSGNLGERLKAAREALGLTQKEMALSLKTYPQNLHVYESGSSIPGGKVLESIARMGISIEWLLTGEGEMLRGENNIKVDSGSITYTISLCDTELLAMVIEAYNNSIGKETNIEQTKLFAEDIARYYNFFSELKGRNTPTLDQIESFMNAYRYILTGIGTITGISGITETDIRGLLEASGVLVPKIDNTKMEGEKKQGPV